MNRINVHIVGVAAGMFLINGIASAGSITNAISWTGVGGYTMTGQFQYSDTLANTGNIVGSQLSSFFIQGFLNGSSIGSWNLASGFTGFLFNFNFNTTTLTFAQGGATTTPTGQAWNTTAGGSTCPNPGFGFASGSAAQGFCVNGSIVNASGSPPNALVATAGVPEPATLALVGLGSLFLLCRKPKSAKRIGC